jgi:hypothetical protein
MQQNISSEVLRKGSKVRYRSFVVAQGLLIVVSPSTPGTLTKNGLAPEWRSADMGFGAGASFSNRGAKNVVRSSTYTRGGVWPKKMENFPARCGGGKEFARLARAGAVAAISDRRGP